jgi:hypothetical protein
MEKINFYGNKYYICAMGDIKKNIVNNVKFE